MCACGRGVVLLCLVLGIGTAAPPLAAGSTEAGAESTLLHLGGPERDGTRLTPTVEGPTPKVVGGVPGTSSEYPWQAELIIESPEGNFLCGGTLIHPYIVLTAAHCLTNEYGELEVGTEVTAWLGRTTLASGGTPIEAYDLWVPTAYNPYTGSSDIGFVSLWEGSSLPRLQIAGPTERALWTPGRAATITGWGLTSEGGSLGSVLQAASISIIDDSTCAQPGVYGNVGFSASTMVCAGNLAGGVGVCNGDSGGPLQAPIDGGGYRLVGVTNWGVGCARPNRPGVFARIADDPLRSRIANAIPVIEAYDEIPPTGVDVIGAGARPPGCAAAEDAVAVASSAEVATAAAVGTAALKLRKSRRAVIGAVAGLQAARRSARHHAMGFRRTLHRATRRLQVAKRRLRASKVALDGARRRAGSASAARVAAEANRGTTCG